MATAYAYTTQHASAETSAEQLDTVTVVPSLQRAPGRQAALGSVIIAVHCSMHSV